MSRSGELAYVDGEVRAAEPVRVLAESAAELEALKGRVSVGTVAHVAGYEQCWQLSAAGEWIAYEGKRLA